VTVAVLVEAVKSGLRRLRVAVPGQPPKSRRLPLIAQVQCHFGDHVAVGHPFRGELLPAAPVQVRRQRGHPGAGEGFQYLAGLAAGGGAGVQHPAAVRRRQLFYRQLGGFVLHRIAAAVEAGQLRHRARRR